MKAPLAPTIWRTCRVLACARRLKVFKVVVEKGPVCVKDVARICRMPENTTTQYLRALQARGLLAANRKSRWVYYVPQADPSVQHAEVLLAVMRKALGRNEPNAEMLAALTAYTHPRRIAMVRQLASKPGTVPDVGYALGISYPASYRHMEKLVRRGVVQMTEKGICQLATPASELAASLLQAALA
ncbi:MAG: hypothetical protein WCR06_07835 [bacterium]